jgi:2-dehydro-3-deoxy-D-arabinonate dehydratase
MTEALFRVRLPGGRLGIALGDSDTGPVALLAPDVTLDDALAAGTDLASLFERPTSAVPDGAVVVAPVESQEVWAAGVTYERSRAARIEEAVSRDPYDLVYRAERPELFFKAPGWRVRGPGEPVAVRADSTWNVPEPELALVLASDLSIVGYTIANDVSSRSIEGRNTLYLPQAKVYDGACALGPCIVPATAAEPPFEIELEIRRDGATIFAGSTSTASMRRSPDELARYLGSALTFPVGAILLTGTGVVPEADVTLLEGDLVRIQIGPLGVLENVVEVVGSAAAVGIEEITT